MSTAEAIAFIEHVRQTHVAWTLYLDAGGEVDVELVGDVAHHTECIEGYDVVLSILRGAA